jgi:RimJ/RimL family protein N-acetyltransferase
VLRPARESDLEAMRLWRNQPANREVSLHQHVITPDEHARWWRTVALDPARRVLVFEADGDACGVVTFFDIAEAADGRTASWGFYLDHERLAESGALLPAWSTIMREAVAYAFEELGLDVLNGEVLEENQAVRSSNRRLRFVEGTPQTTYVDGRQLSVIPVSLRKEDRRSPRSAVHGQG